MDSKMFGLFYGWKRELLLLSDKPQEINHVIDKY